MRSREAPAYLLVLLPRGRGNDCAGLSSRFSRPGHGVCRLVNFTSPDSLSPGGIASVGLCLKRIDLL